MSSSKRLLLGVSIISLLFVGVLILLKLSPEPEPVVVEEETPELVMKQEVVGKSVEGRKIERYTLGNGTNKILFVGGIHGGYEWNSVVLAYRFIDYLKTNPEIVPDNVTVSVIPSLNPDGVFKVTERVGQFNENDITITKEESKLGRFNANKVDLNRNFDCKWKPESTWQGNIVSAGTVAFSEPEAKALRDLVLKEKPKAVIFWHSQANAVYASECENGILPVTREIMDVYSKSTGYKAVDSFDAYEITGDAEGWLASIGIPAISVELETHETVEWERNKLGIKAIFDYFK